MDADDVVPSKREEELSLFVTLPLEEVDPDLIFVVVPVAFV